MVLSRREKILAILMIAGVMAFAGNAFVLNPIFNHFRAVWDERAQLAGQVKEGEDLRERGKIKRTAWDKMLPEGLPNEVEAEGRLARAVDEWAGSARVTLTSVKPERIAGDKQLKEIVLSVAGKGSLPNVTRFLYDVETAKLAVKIKSLTLSPSNESGNDMSLQLVLSSLYVGPANKPAEKQTQPKPQEDNNEEQLL